MEEKILKKWIYRLQYHISNVEHSQGQQKDSAIQALLGYLSSLQMIDECEDCSCYSPQPEKENERIRCKYCQSYKSHSCCWEQGENPACGQELKNHKQCCLCDCIPPQKGSMWL